jgi:hypothetical protein
MTTLRDAVADLAARMPNPHPSLTFETPAGPLWSVTAIAERAEPREDLLTWQTWMLSSLAHTHREHLEQLGADGPRWLQQQLMTYRDAPALWAAQCTTPWTPASSTRRARNPPKSKRRSSRHSNGSRPTTRRRGTPPR